MSFSSEFEKRATFSDIKEKAKEISTPATAAVLAYAALRHRSSFPKGAPKSLQKLRQAAEEHGFARVHLHGKKKGWLGQKVHELTHPADKHIHLHPGKKYAPSTHKGPVFDPDSVGALKTKHKVGHTDSTSRTINKSKIGEYKLGKKLGLKVPKTEKIRSLNSLKSNQIAKPASGSQAKVVVTKKDIQAHDPKHPLLLNYKSMDKGLKKIEHKADINELSVLRNKHPGYRRAMVEQAIKSPHKFVKQPKINIDKEYRVHALHGVPFGSAGRQKLTFTGHKDAEKFVERHLKRVDPKLKNNLLAADVAKDKSGRWHMIETNPGPESGYLTPTNELDFRGPHHLHKFITGRHSKAVAGAGALGAGAATYAGKKLIDKKKDQP